MLRSVIASGLIATFLVACDSGQEPLPDPPKTKGLYDLKQASDTKMSKEELEEARRKAGFKSHEEQIAEAKEAYEKMERGYVKGRVDAYRKLLGDLRKNLDTIEKEAPKWAKAKDPDAAFGKWNDKYKEQAKAFMTAYSELTEDGTRGGDLQVRLNAVVGTWEALNGDLGPQIAEAEQFPTTLADLRTNLDEIEKLIGEIEKDDTIEADPPQE